MSEETASSWWEALWSYLPSGGTAQQVESSPAPPAPPAPLDPSVLLESLHKKDMEIENLTRRLHSARELVAKTEGVAGFMAKVLREAQALAESKDAQIAERNRCIERLRESSDAERQRADFLGDELSRVRVELTVQSELLDVTGERIIELEAQLEASKVDHKQSVLSCIK